MSSLSAIILTYNEELHIRRCIEAITPYVKQIFMIDCFSSDKTIDICKEYEKVTVIQHEWPGNQALQFNWSLANLNIATEWIIRLDADEYLLPGEGKKLVELLSKLKEKENGVSMIRARYFLGKHIRHGGTDWIPLLRVFRKGTACSEIRAMDEHIILKAGAVIETDIRFADNNLNNLEWWAAKHLNYARREAAMLLATDEVVETEKSINLGKNVRNKRKQKQFYERLPLFWRAFGYFIYRYIFRLGFLDGKEGFLWHFLQAWWYRTMVDIIIYAKNK